MANPEHLEILKSGVKKWNAWRSEGSGIVPDLTGADLAATNLTFARLKNTNLSGADLNGSRLVEAVFDGANLEGANLHGAVLVRARLVAANLHNTNLHGANLMNADFARANLSDSCLSDACLHGGVFREANLRGADIKRAQLFSAVFREADLSGADFELAHLDYTDLERACLIAANLTSAQVGFTTFTALDLSRTKGLETVHHFGPSAIGIDTLYLSGGEIPEVFLRGCGVPDNFITQVKSLVGAEEGMKFDSCFLSHSHEDKNFCNRLHARM